MKKALYSSDIGCGRFTTYDGIYVTNFNGYWVLLEEDEVDKEDEEEHILDQRVELPWEYFL